MTVLVAGATGFTGSFVVPLLLEKELLVRCLVRESSDKSVLACDRIEWVYGDLDDVDSLKRALHGVEILVNIASLGFGHAPSIVQACVAAGVERAIFISTTAIFTSLKASSKSVRLAAEKTIRGSGLAFTILRPTMIYGSSRDRNMSRLIRYLERWPIVPVLGNGRYLQQPVHVKDVARAVVECVMTERTIGKSYNIAGATALTYNQVIDTICELTRCRICKVYIPVSPTVGCVRAAERLGLNLPVKAEQILRLNENKAFNFDEATRDFGYSPRSFVEGIRLQLKEMGMSIKR